MMLDIDKSERGVLMIALWGRGVQKLFFLEKTYVIALKLVEQQEGVEIRDLWASD